MACHTRRLGFPTRDFAVRNFFTEFKSLDEQMQARSYDRLAISSAHCSSILSM
jgi:hypothetical protein